MNRQQFDLITSLLRIVDPIRSAARDVFLDRRDQDEAIAVYGCPPDAARTAINRVRDAERGIRGAFVHHRAAEWEVVVGHNDHHRRLGKVTLEAGQTVWLVCRWTYIKLPVRVIELSRTPAGYHRGTIDEPIDSTRYAAGDSVSFGEEQALLTPTPARMARARKPLSFI